MYQRTGLLVNHANGGFIFSRILPDDMPNEVEVITKYLQVEACVGSLDDAEILVMQNGVEAPEVICHWSALNGDFEGFMVEVEPDPFPSLPPPAE